IAFARSAWRQPISVVASALAFALPIAAELGGAWPDRMLLALTVLPVASLALAKDPPRDVEDWLWSVATVLYFGWLASRFVLPRNLGGGCWWVFVGVVPVWKTNPGAFSPGRVFGRHKLAPAVSPGKTWEGAIAGQVSGFVAVVGIAKSFDLGLSWADLVALG